MLIDAVRPVLQTQKQLSGFALSQTALDAQSH